jgi:hypothetical protein
MLPTREGRLMRTLRVAVVLIFVATVGSAGTAGSWGDVGHKIICEIASQELSDHARAEVRRLINLDSEFSLLFESCTWADHPWKRASSATPDTSNTTPSAYGIRASPTRFLNRNTLRARRDGLPTAAIWEQPNDQKVSERE